VVSDRLFRGRRSPVAMWLYFMVAAVCALAAVLMCRAFSRRAQRDFLELSIPDFGFVQRQRHALTRWHGGADGHRRAPDGGLCVGCD